MLLITIIYLEIKKFEKLTRLSEALAYPSASSTKRTWNRKNETKRHLLFNISKVNILDLRKNVLKIT